MPYLCKSCGNKRDFKQNGFEDGTCTISRSATSYMDENGGETDYNTDDDIDYGDSDWDGFDSDDSVACNECGEDVDDVSSAEWEEWVEGDGEGQEEKEPERPGKVDILKKALIGDDNE